jgi:hypothetical protein
MKSNDDIDIIELDNGNHERDIHRECKNRCITPILFQYIELYPESLSHTDDRGFLPLHLLLSKECSSVEVALMMIEKYPAALKHRDGHGLLPIHIECSHERRSSIISRCIEIYPESLAEVDSRDLKKNLPLHILLMHQSDMRDALMMIERYPAALKHQNSRGNLPLHIECKKQCRSSIIAKSIQLYPQALANADEEGYLPLHLSLQNSSYYGRPSVDDALMMIEKYPAAVRHQGKYGLLPLHIECREKCRPPIITKCMELYPEALNDLTITCIVEKIHKNNFYRFSAVLSIVFTASPMSLYHHYRYISAKIDYVNYSTYRRRILNLLPRRVFTPTHDADYRNLNWQPRAAMIMLLSQMKIQQHGLNTDQAAEAQSGLMEDGTSISDRNTCCSIS